MRSWSMTNLITVLLANFLFIGLRAFQQLNVMHSRYQWVLPTSTLMAFCEVFVIAQIAINGFTIPIVLAIAIGGGTGCMLSMWLHSKARG